MTFRDRGEAGEKLAGEIAKMYGGRKCVVFAIPRGGVVLGAIVAKKLNCPLDLVITRKIGHPTNPEYAVCVVAEDGHRMCNDLEAQQLEPKWLEREIDLERAEARRRRRTYLGDRSRIDLATKTAILVDDGIATGLTFEAAIMELRHLGPKKLVAAVPVVPEDSYRKLKLKVDDFIALSVETDFRGAVGSYYDYFPQVEDEEVIRLLRPT